MKKKKLRFTLVLPISLFLLSLSFTQEPAKQSPLEEQPQEEPLKEEITPESALPLNTEETSSQAGLFSEEEIIPAIKFKDTDIRIVLQAVGEKISRKGKKVNVVFSPQVQGLVNVDFREVKGLEALEAITKSYGYGYEWMGENIVFVATFEELEEVRKKHQLARELEPLETITYRLKFLDAYDVVDLLKGQLSERGRITVLPVKIPPGWKRAELTEEKTQALGAPEREEAGEVLSNTLVITDTKSNLEKIIAVLERIDVRPQRVLIEAKIVEVNRDKLKDIGFDLGTGQSGVTSSYSLLGLDKDSKKALGGISSGDVSPSIFIPKAQDITGTIPYNMGLELIFRKLTGAEFEVVLHALEEKVDAKILSAPRLVTLDGREAYIMVGEKRPIIKSEIQSSETSVGISKKLDYYQPIGIQLTVIPKVCGDNSISMLLYPSITSTSQSVPATSQIGSTTTTDYYPILLVRQTQTQILLKDGETIAIGGLIKDVINENIFKVPLLGDIPLLGYFFKRKTYDTEKVELIIFITTRILKAEGNLPESLTATTSVEGELDKLNEIKKRSVEINPASGGKKK